MSFFPVPAVPPYNLEAEAGDSYSLHIDLNFANLAATLNQLLACVQLIERDDGLCRNGSVHADAFDSSALALIAGSTAGVTRWIPRGFWLTATVYEVTDIVETGTPGVSYVCVVAHVSGTFATDHAAGKWVVLSAPRTLISADIVAALGFTPVNKAGDTMTGALIAPTGTEIAGLGFSTTSLANTTAIDGALYANYVETSLTVATAFSADIVRGSGAGFIAGTYERAFAATGSAIGHLAEALGLHGNHSGALTAASFTVTSLDADATNGKVGTLLAFANRLNSSDVAGAYSYALPTGTLSNVGGALSTNQYNRNAIAAFVTSQAPSATGEYCGWTRGMKFDEYALDSETNASYPGSRAYPIGIDFSEMHYYGGTDPVLSSNLEGAIALRSQQSILWNRISTFPAQANKVRTYWDLASGRWIISGGGVERFGLDTTTGEIYKNGSPLSSVTLAGNNTWTGINTYNNGVIIAANQLFSGNGRRILGDMTSVPAVNRLSVQTSVAGSATEFQVLPSVGGTSSGMSVFSDPAVVAGQFGRLSVADGIMVLLESNRLGASAYLPLGFATGGGSMQLSAAGALLVNTTSAPVAGAKLRVNGIAQIDNPVAFSVNRGGTAFNVVDNTVTQVNWTAEAFDTGNCFDLATDRFTPPAGYYHFDGCCTQLGAVAEGVILCSLYMNGAPLHNGGRVSAGSFTLSGANLGVTVYANGTDYFDMRVYQANPTATTLSFAGDAVQLYFSGHRVG